MKTLAGCFSRCLTLHSSRFDRDRSSRFDQPRFDHPGSRLALFIIFFWFGVLKLFAKSPANALIDNLLEITVPLDPHWFVIALGLYEMTVGVLFLSPRLRRVALALLLPHMMATFLPLIVLPHLTWQEFGVPTIEGQYIIKNLVIVALAVVLSPAPASRQAPAAAEAALPSLSRAA